MYIQNGAKSSVFLILLVFVGLFIIGCEAMENILPSSGTYKINLQINSTLLDECSYVRSIDKITPCFEDPISDDPDVTALMVFFKDALGNIVGWKVVYIQDQEAEKKEKLLTDENKNNDVNKNANEDKDKSLISDNSAEESTITVDVNNPKTYKNGDELIVPVLSLDDKLPSFSMPENLPMGKYTMVSQVMSGKNVLQKTEKNIFFLGKNTFSYKGINIYLPGISTTSQLITKGTVVMLEADLNFNKQLDPYIVWYEGKNKISEGHYSDGANLLFWKAPEQSGFFLLRAEVFPVESVDELTGFKKEISLLVSSKTTDIHLASANAVQLKHWYVMEGNLNNSKMPTSFEFMLQPTPRNKPKWMGLDGTYGLATGYKNILTLPKIKIVNKEAETWQALFRFKPLDNGNIFSVQFGSSSNVLMTLNIRDNDLILSLVSPLKTVSQIVNLSSTADESFNNTQVEEQENPFVTAGIGFSIQGNFLTAQINIIGNPIPIELEKEPISLKVEIKNDFIITLGFLENVLHDQFQIPVEELESSAKQVKTKVLPEYNVLWDEFALYYMPPSDILSLTVKSEINEDQPLHQTEN